MDVEVNDIPVLNPSDLPQDRHYRWSRGYLFKMSTNVGDYGYIWSDSDEIPLEEWVDYLDDVSPSIFETVDEDDLKEAAEDLGKEWQDDWPDWGDPEFAEVAEHAEADLDVIGHTTLKSGTHIPKDAWSFETIETYSDEYNEVWCACAKAIFDEEGEWPDKPRGVDCPAMKGWAMRDDLDGVPGKRSVPAWIRR